MLNKKVLQFGLMMGCLSILLSVLIYLMGVEFMTNWWTIITVGLVGLGFKIFFSLRLKKTSGFESISYWQAFFAIIIVSVIAGILSLGYERAINYLDPHLMENIENATIRRTASMMENLGMPQENIDQAIDDIMEKFEEAKNVTFAGMAKDMSFVLLWYAVFAFIMAIFVRKSLSVIPESEIQQSTQNQ